MIDILSASAGSGKTTRLAKEYIKILLKSEDRYAYKHILAVTFTNKATDEMKSRILEDLHLLSVDPAKCQYINELVPDLAADVKDISAKSETVLCNILHDYGAFSVSTIDRFFQQALKAFSREIGQFASYAVELDRTSLINESVDRVLDSLTESPEDKKKLDYLTNSAISQLEEGNGYKLERTLKEMAVKLKSEEHRVLVEKAGLDEKELYSESTLKKLRTGCSSVEERFRKDVSDGIKAIFDRIADCGLSLSNFSGVQGGFNENSLSKWVDLGKEDDIPAPSLSFICKASDKKSWFKKADSYLADKVSPELEDAIKSFLDLFGQKYSEYRTAGILKDQIRGLGIAGDLRKEFSALMKEKNVLCLDDSNAILKNIIDGTDTPFIYEKLGVRFEHFLLDEFQDTSKVQWDNFRPLLKESVSNGRDNLVVGDIKQSIYRWRGSDWNLLDKEIPSEFEGSSRMESLNTNWRSLSDIVEFNNGFFTYAASVLDKKYGDGKTTIADIYKDIRQEVAEKNRKTGCVRISFCEAEEETTRTLEAVRTAVSNGYSYEDIGILVRGNSEGEEIANRLIAEGIQVVTDDSLHIRSSLTVRRLIALLTGIDSPDDKISSYLSEDLGISVPEDFHSVSELCEDLLRKLKTADSKTFEAETLYIQSFMDLVHDFVFLDRGSLHEFLQKIKDNDSKISSPSQGNAVRVMTIHKSKGLAFPYVIVPFIDKVTLFKPSESWCKPNVEGTSLEDFAKGVYNVSLSSKVFPTLFKDNYMMELMMQYVDNINVAYVAFTRAREAMHIIGCTGGRNANMAQILYDYVSSEDPSIVCTSTNEYMRGVIPAHIKTDRPAVKDHPSGYNSWESGNRIGISADASDYFSEDGLTGTEASARLKGIVLHNILSDVLKPSDLEEAVRKSITSGDFDETEAKQALLLLESRIKSAAQRGWFPEEGAIIRNETVLMGIDGVMRPDRVIETQDGKTIIVDYKFGAHKDIYLKQIRTYANSYRHMGRKDVRAFLWYVMEDEVVELDSELFDR